MSKSCVAGYWLMARALTATIPPPNLQPFPPSPTQRVAGLRAEPHPGGGAPAARLPIQAPRAGPRAPGTSLAPRPQLEGTRRAAAPPAAARPAAAPGPAVAGAAWRLLRGFKLQEAAAFVPQWGCSSRRLDRSTAGGGGGGNLLHRALDMLRCTHSVDTLYMQSALP